MRDAAKTNDGVALAGISLAVVTIINIYRDAAPSLEEIRTAEPGSPRESQLILDADMLGGIVVLAIGGGAAILTEKLYPFIFGLVSLAMISAYYRSVLRSSNERMLS